MKKLTGLILCLLLVSLCAFAMADVAINETNFPDPVFQERIRQFDADGNGSFSDAEIAAVTEMDVGTPNESYGPYISDMTGIGFFTALQKLECVRNMIPSLDLSSNTELTLLDCTMNPLTSLNISKNNKLTLLWLPITQISQLDVSMLHNLKQLNCQNSSVGSLVLNEELEILYCDLCDLSSLDLCRQAKLTAIQCQNNHLESLNVRNIPNLEVLYCNGNNISSLDISHNPKLNFLMVQDTGISELDVRNNPFLNRLVRTTSRGNFTLYEVNYQGWCVLQEPWFSSCLFCDSSVNVISADIPVTSITLNKTKATMTRTSDNKKPTLQLTATVLPENATDPSVEWTSSDPKVAKVDGNGKVTVLKKGTAVITCAAKDGSGVKAECKITVRDKPVSKITLNKKKVTIKLGKTFQLKVTKLSPANALNQKVTWKSSNTKIAAVDKNGKVKARKKGTCTITCTAKDGSGRKVTCKVTVK